MGGYRSGRWATRHYLDDHHALDVAWLARGGVLSSGWGGDLTSTSQRTGQVRHRVSVFVWDDLMHLRFRFAGGEGQERRDVEQTVVLLWTSCGFGGQRPWFQCPGHGCRRRVGKLYKDRNAYLCRHCQDLTYESKSESEADRRLRRANAIRRRLGGQPGPFYPPPAKPKGMWWRTYDRLSSELCALEQRILMASALDLGVDPQRLSGRGIVEGMGTR